MATEDKITIEKGIPLPNGTTKYPWGKMEVGDSFVVPMTMRNSAGTAAKRFGIKVAVRRIDDAHVRVWRVA